jgi:hypothetical protein
MIVISGFDCNCRDIKLFVKETSRIALPVAPVRSANISTNAMLFPRQEIGYGSTKPDTERNS